jgi:hypothetical protein
MSEIKMYVANCSSQNVEFNYRLPEVPSPRMQPIPIGRQIQISGTLSSPDVEAIIAQHAIYGLVHVSEIDRTRPFVGLCWSEKPISVDKVKRMWLHNQGVLAERGKEQRQAAAVATQEHIEDKTPGSLKALEMSVEEVPTEGKPEPDFSEGVRVTNDPEETEGRGKSQGRGKNKGKD